MSKSECNVVRDLMPLCIDGAASEESWEMVDIHVTQCEECAQIYSGMHTELPMQENDQEQREMDLAARQLRQRRLRRAVIVGVIGMVAGILIFLVLMNVDEIAFRARYVHWNGDLKSEALFAKVSGDQDGPLRYVHLTSTPSSSPHFEFSFEREILAEGAVMCLQVRAIYKGRDTKEYDAGGVFCY